MPKAKRNPLTMAAFIAWLKKHSPRKRYVYLDLCDCLGARYNDSIGREYGFQQICGGTKFDAQLETIALLEPHTYGAALKRAQKLVENGKVQTKAAAR